MNTSSRWEWSFNVNWLVCVLCVFSFVMLERKMNCTFDECRKSGGLSFKLDPICLNNRLSIRPPQWWTMDKMHLQPVYKNSKWAGKKTHIHITRSALVLACVLLSLIPLVSNETCHFCGSTHSLFKSYRAYTPKRTYTYSTTVWLMAAPNTIATILFLTSTSLRHYCFDGIQFHC